MKVLEGHRVVAVGDGAGGALARFLTSLGAQIEPSTPERLQADLRGASFLLDYWSAPQWRRMPDSPDTLTERYPQLIHISVTPFGRDGPRAEWSGNELIVSALGGALGLTGDPDRAPVKEALDACLF
ncbi:MAG TPA: CoA transferase, partial [Steroidobacteraceae bacterium]|nr:CoA transferase [Steroidobacteraceae bacterium]